MLSLRNIPLNRKLTVISMLTSGAALLLACGVIVGFELVRFRQAMVGHAQTTAKMIGDNSAAALTFGDPQSAEQTLRSLGADKHIVAALIYDHQGKTFAQYQPPGAIPLTPPAAEQNLHRFASDSLEIFSDISVAGESIGTVYLRHDMTELWDNLQRSGWLMLGVIAVASLVAWLLTRHLQPLVAGPIIDLAQVVRAVALNKDFSVRAVKQGEDEVGRLIDGFNEMLAQIQQRDSALQAAQDGLEKRVAERTMELASSLSVLNATLDSTADGILAMQLSGEILCYNTQFATMWEIPREVLARRVSMEMAEFLSTKVSNPKQFLERIEELLRCPEKLIFEVVELKDGRSFERYVKLQRVEGEVVGVVINYRDITKRKKDEAELENIHKSLLETSRLAGMAEVATGVLHNVGNVLNSVNVSATLVARSMKKSKVVSLGRVVALLEQHAPDLSAFVTSNAQGKNLPRYLRQLHECLCEEQRSVLAEVESLQQNVEHIKDIVSMQQEYAKVSGVTEILKVADLVEESLRMDAAALARHGITVERDYHDAAPIAIEKHKTLQILVNLIRNAKHACDEGGRTDKRLTLRVTNGDGRVKISVSDNGVGIPLQNLTRIFNHGFTTRKDGHGFGLHSGALAATEMGGALRVHSDGPGRGATFTLELPVDRPARPNGHPGS